MKVFRVAVTGGRDHVITHEEDKRFRALLQEKWLSGGVIHVVVLHGNCRGVDQRAAEIAESAGFPAVPFEAPWKWVRNIAHLTLEHHAQLTEAQGFPRAKIKGIAEHVAKKAGPLRNYVMLGAADLLVAFPGGIGTDGCVRQAVALGVEVIRL